MNRQNYYPSVDGLKGIFIFFIVLHNLLPAFPPAGNAGRIIDAIPLTSFISIYGGTLGNGLFFMLSGFLMATGYQNKIRQHSIAFPDFLCKRLRKLYPMYILTNFFMLVLSVLEYGPSGVNLKRVIATALIQLGGGLRMHPYNGPSWFLSSLFLCYMLYFAVSYFTSGKTSYFFSLVSGVLMGCAILAADWDISFLHYQTGMGILNFSIGCIMAEVYPFFRERIPRWLPGACLFTLVVSFYLMLRYGVEIIAGDSQTAFYFLICPMILYLALDSKWICSFLQTKPIQFLGKISLCVYFWHHPIFDAMRNIYRMFGMELTEVYFPLYLLVLVLFCILYNRFAHNRKAASVCT